MPTVQIIDKTVISNARTRIAGLDTLRGLAIMLVLLYHCTPNSNPNLGLSSLVFKVANIGWAGVDLFFALSGYLVCSMLLDIKQRGRPVSVFFWNRLLRIMPIYYLTLALVLIAYPAISGAEMPRLHETYPYWLYINNNILDLNASFYAADINLGHFWSLALEMQFYVLIPLLVMYCSRKSLVTTLAITWLGVITWRFYAVYTGTEPDITFGFSQFRCDGLLLGALVAARRDPLKSQPAFLCLALLSACYLIWMIWLSQGSAIFKHGTDFYLHRALLPTTIGIVSAYALTMALKKKEYTGVFRFSILAFLAKYSYGIYIYHFLFNDYLEDSLVPWLSAFLLSQNQVAFGFFSLQLCLSTSVAWISFHFFEKHFLALKKH
ncbi:acyltransferase family protein [Arenicella xantha]|uniref:Peptidoglycan/LPS O-acetylase OafA/YrhL n=1 Tax=Arenicella xantha TaxID=644221 RepID=A0A395JGR1_9GAMM|nr:acyltransferase [Arenicella xantha]RBP49170.1 peptidoglycan/LPS O-acetylase OafA/YrhL [Arenicella xantha]